jgi:hypothetical protein
MSDEAKIGISKIPYESNETANKVVGGAILGATGAVLGETIGVPLAGTVAGAVGQWSN